MRLNVKLCFCFAALLLASFFALLSSGTKAYAQVSAIPSRRAPLFVDGDQDKSLLDLRGQLLSPVSEQRIIAWKAECNDPQTPLERKAWLHIWLGECSLTQDENPQLASWHFRRARQLTPECDAAYGCAYYDDALTFYRQGAYVRSRETFLHILRMRHPYLLGFDHANASLLMRHVSAYAGVHERNSDLGIPEPPELDPKCGAAALAICLRGLGIPYDYQAVSTICRISGLGSNTEDITAGARKLGLATYAVAANDAGLIALPKPCIAHAEGDHFVAVLKADRRLGVTYVCSDCGRWPGGNVHVTWKQWHAIAPDLYQAIVRPDSIEDRALLRLSSRGVQRSDSVRNPGKPEGSLQVALRRGASGLTSPAERMVTALYIKLAGNVIGKVTGQLNLGCGTAPVNSSNPGVRCPKNGSGSGGPGGGPGSPGGPSGGEPVNLATGEESYTPTPDLVIYNPIGPSVTWSRIYDSGRPDDDIHEVGDFGSNWSQPYAATFVTAGATPQAPTQIAPGGTGTTGASGPANPIPGQTWDISLNGTVLATSSNPGDWSMTWLYGGMSVTVPANASPVAGYVVQYYGDGYSSSARFDVLAPGSFPAGLNEVISSPGTDAPASVASNGVGWDVVLNGQIVATSIHPHGWSASFAYGGGSGGVNTVSFVIPLSATMSSGYEIRYQYGGYGAFSGYFTAIPHRFRPVVGHITLMMPDGGSAEFAAPTIPDSNNQVVVCTPAGSTSGIGMQVAWHYSAADACGYYVATSKDGSSWVTTTPVKSEVDGNINHARLYYRLARIVNRVGNAINLNYSFPVSDSKGFPLLSSITDATSGTALLTISRNTNDFSAPGSDGNNDVGDLISKVTDAYGRSVSYSYISHWVGNGPPTEGTYFYLLHTASQVAASSTANPPMRYTYEYQTLFLAKPPVISSIAVPSPTGTGNSVMQLTYDPSTGVVLTHTDGNNIVTSYDYSQTYETGITIRNPQGATVYAYKIGFDQNMNETYETDGTGTRHLYDISYGQSPGAPNLPSTIEDAAGRAINMTWDAYGYPLSSTSNRGVVTTYTYQDQTSFPRLLASIQQGNKQPTTFTFTPSGQIATVTSPAPTGSGVSTVTTSYTYTPLGNILSVTVPGNGTATSKTTTFGYTQDNAYSQPECLGQPITVTDNLGHVQHVRYDAMGRAISSTDALGNETDTTYDLVEPLSVSLPPTGQTGTGRTTSVYTYEYTGGPPASTILYDESGNAIPGHQVNFVYGLEGETLATNRDGVTTSQQYDALYRKISVTDGNNHVTTYAYGNPAGYLSQITMPGGETIQYLSYDALGRVLQRMDGNGVTTSYTYNDTAGALSAINYSDGTAGANFTYDTYGRLTGKSDGSGSYTYSYDDRNALTSATTTYTGMAALTLSYGFNPDGSRSVMSTPAGNFTYTYDAGGRPQSLTNPYGETTTWSYLDNNWLSSQVLDSAQSLQTTYAYNAMGQMTSLANYGNTSTTPLSAFTGMQYDGAGNRLSVVDLPFSTTTGNDLYQYNAKDQLTQEFGPSGSQSSLGNYSSNYAYDNAGNPTTFAGNAVSYNANNQRTGTGFAYDGNGNPTTYQGAAFIYDANNKPTTIGTALYCQYGIDGKRTYKQGHIGVSGQRIYYLYDGDKPVLEVAGNYYAYASSIGTAANKAAKSDRAKLCSAQQIDLPAPVGPVQAAPSSGDILAVNTFGANGLVSRHVVFTNTTSYYQFDERGNTVSTTDKVNGNFSSTSSPNHYSAYGTKTVNNVDTTPFGFGGQWGYYTDEGTGLILCGQRYYDPGTGRWINRDPIGYSGGLNLYAYCDGNPIMAADPSGLSPDDPWYDALAQSASYGIEQQKEIINDYYATSGAGVATATVATTAIDYVGGFLSLPSQIGHFGEGAGAFAGDPSACASEGLMHDVATSAQIALALIGVPETEETVAEPEAATPEIVNPKETRVIGRLQDTAPYRNRPGFNVAEDLGDDWNRMINREWLIDGLLKGDDWLLVTDPVVLEEQFAAGKGGMHTLWELRELQRQANRLGLDPPVIQRGW